MSALPADPPSVRNARSADAPGIAEVHVASWRAAYAGQLPDRFLRKLSVDERTRSWRSRIAARRADETVLVAVRGEIDLFTALAQRRLTHDAGYTAIQQIPGIGPVLAAVFVAEIGDVTRFASARHLCSWAGLTPRHRESDTTVHRGPITKQGSALVRWAAVEAVQRIPASAGWLVSTRAAITERRGRNIATVAVARRLLTLVYYGLRDGHIRALQRQPAGARAGAGAGVA